MKHVLVVFGLMMMGMSAQAQTNGSGEVTISMGLIPVFELSQQAGCPYLLAAPSPLYYNLSYKKCSGDRPIQITDWQDKYRINDFMREICNENRAEMNGCQVELIVNYPDGWNVPHYTNQDNGDEE